MMGTTHRALGFASAGAMALILPAPDALLPLGAGIFAAIIGSLLPDIDHPESIVGKRFRLLAGYLNRAHGHRYLTHSILFVGATTALVGLAGFLLGLGLYPGLGFFLGILSHVAADAVSYSGHGKWLSSGNCGVALAYPMNRIRYGIRLVKVGGMTELYVIRPIALLVGLMMLAVALGDPAGLAGQ